MSLMPESSGKLALSGERVGGIQVHGRARQKPSLPRGPFTRLRDGRLLSLSFSEDEAGHWSPPMVVARHKGGEVSYPQVFEPEPGRRWITAHRGNLRRSLCAAGSAPQ